MLALDSLFLATGEQAGVAVRVLDRRGAEVAGGAAVAWSTDDVSVALVSGQGLVTAVAPGVARVMADLGGVRDTVHVLVTHVASAAGVIQVDPNLPSSARAAIAVIQTSLHSAPMGAGVRVPAASGERSYALALNAAGKVIFLSSVQGTAVEIGALRTARDLLDLVLDPGVTGIEPGVDVAALAENSPQFSELVSGILAASSTPGGFAESAAVRAALDALVAYGIAAAAAPQASIVEQRIEGPCTGTPILLDGVPLSAWDMPAPDERLCLSNSSLIAWSYRLSPSDAEGFAFAREGRTWEAIRSGPGDPSWTAIPGRIGSVSIAAGQDFRSKEANVARVMLDVMGIVVSLFPPTGLLAADVAKCAADAFAKTLGESRMDAALGDEDSSILLSYLESWLTEPAGLVDCFGKALPSSVQQYLRSFLPVINLVESALNVSPVWLEVWQSRNVSLSDRAVACHTRDSRLFPDRCGAIDLRIRGSEADGPLPFDVVITRADGWEEVVQVASGSSRAFADLAAVSHRVTVRPPAQCAAGAGVTLVPESRIVEVAANQTIVAEFEGRCRVPAPALTPGERHFVVEEGSAVTDPQAVVITATQDEPGVEIRIGAAEYQGAAAGWLLTPELSATVPPATLQLRVDPGNLAPGTYSATVPVTLASASGTAATALQVTLEVIPPRPEIALSDSSVAFEAQAGGADPAPATISVTNSGRGALEDLAVSVAYTGAGGWLTATLDRAQAPASIVLTPSAQGLAAGTHVATVQVTSGTALNSPRTVEVTFTVQQGEGVTGAWAGEYWYGDGGPGYTFAWRGTMTQTGSQVVAVLVDAGNCEWTMTGTANGSTIELPTWTLGQPAPSICNSVVSPSLRGTLSEDGQTITGTGVGIYGWPFGFRLQRVPSP